MPARKSTPVMLVLFHQSQATCPGFIHDGSLMRHAGPRTLAMVLPNSCLSWSVTSTMRQGSLVTFSAM